ncbi:MAG: hypothetical protein Kow0097_13410 [Candidatus Bipolaricaulota bacterium]
MDVQGLDEDQALEQLIEGPEPAGEGDERLGVLDEHHLAHEGVPEGEEAGLVRVRFLLVRELDVEPDAPPA